MKRLIDVFSHYDLAVTTMAPEIKENKSGEEEVVYKAIITITTFTNEKEQARVMRKVQAVGIGKSQREAERDGIEEALLRLGV